MPPSRLALVAKRGGHARFGLLQVRAHQTNSLHMLEHGQPAGGALGVEQAHQIAPDARQRAKSDEQGGRPSA